MDAREFYDKMSADPHLSATGWAGSMEHQGEVIEGLIRKAIKTSGPFRVLDCSCGSGAQSLGLAARGHIIIGTDISSVAIQKAKVERDRKALPVDFRVADMRSLEGVNGPFDAVIAFGNSLSHLTSEADLAFAFSSVLSVLRPGGVFLASMRDYDSLRKDRPTGTMPRRILDSYGERVYVQTWDWREDGKSYDLRLFVLHRSGENWTASPLETLVRAYTRGEIATELEKTGFLSSEWFFTEQTAYYQPILLARKA